jgi:uncharacterized membrane protein YkvA (DUF1232 family)
MKAAHSELRAEIQHHAADAIAAYADSTNISEDVAAELITSVTMFYIKSVSVLGRQLAEKLRDPAQPISVRLAIASVLVYLVQPHDLIADDVPAGYGLIDDALLLRAGYVEYLRCFPLPEWSFQQEARIVNHLVQLCPRYVRPTLLQAISDMGVSLQLLAGMSPQDAAYTLAQIIAEPFAFSMPVAPEGFVPRPAMSYEQGGVLSGAYFENGNVFVPGGPMLVDGQLFVAG